MSKQGLPPAVQALIWSHLRTVDHVAVLLALRTLGTGDSVAVGTKAMLSPETTSEILHEFQTRALVVRQGQEYRFEPDEALAGAVTQLDEMYNTKPVTLVRAIYDRPAHVIQQFADAFRLRSHEDDT